MRCEASIPAFSRISSAEARPIPKMYVNPISTFLSFGRSIPEIRAIGRLALTLLVLRIALADDASHAVALDNLAVLTDRLHAATYFHGTPIIAERGIFRSSHLE